MPDATDLPAPDASCDGGDLDCGSGLLLIIRNEMAPLGGGQVLEVKSREISVKEDLPAWCRMVGHTMITTAPAPEGYTHYYIRKRVEETAEETPLAEDVAEAKRYIWRVRVRGGEGMKARVYVRNHAFDVGQPASFDTEDDAPSAIEIMLASIASCLAVGLRWRASRERVEIFDLEVSLRARADNIMVFLGVEDDGHPGLAGVEGRCFVDTDADDAVIERLWRETVERSPVTQTLVRTIPFDVDVRRS